MHKEVKTQTGEYRNLKKHRHTHGSIDTHKQTKTRMKKY